MTGPEGFGLDDVVRWLWAGLTALLAAVWTRLNRRIDRLEERLENTVKKDVFKDHADRIRADTKELFTRDDAIKDLITDLRKDMHNQFNRLSDQIRNKG